MSSGPRIGISLGDPNGIGPEITIKALVACANEPLTLIPIGDTALLEQLASQLNLPVPNTVLSGDPFPHMNAGAKTAQAGRVSADWVERGIAACLAGELDALVTAPICKESWQAAGVSYPGHTELLADRCGTDRFGMLLTGRGLRVILATRHIPLGRVATELSEVDVRIATTLMADYLRRLKIPDPDIAICGLNPHAGDGGAIGREEVDWLTALVGQLQDEGLPVSGPHPADNVFHHAVKGRHDGVVAMYHDQGLAPLKLWAFDEGVNVTLGLPFVRTSPDHGTAFDIAGKGVAHPGSMLAAIKTAQELLPQS